MNLSLFKTHTLKIAALFITAASLLTACSKGGNNPGDPTAGYPKDVTIEYKVTSLEGNNKTARITYDNETGAETSGVKSLPFSVTVKRKVPFATIVSVIASCELPGKLRLQLLVDGKELKKEEPINTSSGVSGVIAYQFGN